MSSAFHGYYIGYSLFFVGLFVIDEAWAAINRSAIAEKAKRLLPGGVWMTVVSTATIQMLLRFSSINFFLLTWVDCMAYCIGYFKYIFLLPLSMIALGKLTVVRQQ